MELIQDENNGTAEIPLKHTYRFVEVGDVEGRKCFI